MLSLQLVSATRVVNNCMVKTTHLFYVLVLNLCQAPRQTASFLAIKIVLCILVK